MLNKEELKETIAVLLAKNLSFEEMCQEVNLPRYKLIHILTLLKNNPKYIRDNITSLVIKTSEKVMIISDTHLGSKFENSCYLEMAYQKAQDEKITTIVHTGDLLEGMPNAINPFRSYEKQLEHVIFDYPKYENISTYILLGNHDYKFNIKGYEVDEIIAKERNDLKILGFKKGYMKVDDDLISLNHQVSKYHLNIPNYSTIASFLGHSHKVKFNKNNTIYVPTLSDDSICRVGNKEDKPGFLITTITNSDILVEAYQIKKENSKKVKQIIYPRIKTSS